MADSCGRLLATGSVLVCLTLLTGCARVPGASAHAAPFDAPRRNVVLIGDSTTWGVVPSRQGRQSEYNPGTTLEKLLSVVEPPPDQGGTPWKDARVHNLAVSASTSEHWLSRPPAGCDSPLEVFPVVRAACARGTSWVEAIPAAIGDVPPDVVIVDLGINDALITRDPNQTVDRLVAIRDALAPTPVLLFPPIAPGGGPRGEWPGRVRAEMERRGLVAARQYPTYVPTYDDLHPTSGGYVAKAGMWIDGLRSLR
jgi:lysophospholipase L1-like esterase